jgi:hypothetical protein
MPSDQLSVRDGFATLARPALAVNSCRQCGRWLAMNEKENGSGITERRQASRIRVELPVEVTPPDQSETRSEITRDVSASGMFYETEHVLPLGAPIRVVLPLERGLPEESLRVLCEGRVVRVESREGKAGVAVAFTSYRFEPGD